MSERALRVGMEVIERALHDLAEDYAVPIAESHWVLDGTDDQVPHCLCFYVQGDGDPYCLEFTAGQLVTMAHAHQSADRSTVETLMREKIQALAT
jgi:hypothetical protein